MYKLGCRWSRDFGGPPLSNIGSSPIFAIGPLIDRFLFSSPSSSLFLSAVICQNQREIIKIKRGRWGRSKYLPSLGPHVK